MPFSVSSVRAAEVAVSSLPPSVHAVSPAVIVLLGAEEVSQNEEASSRARFEGELSLIYERYPRNASKGLQIIARTVRSERIAGSAVVSATIWLVQQRMTSSAAPVKNLLPSPPPCSWTTVPHPQATTSSTRASASGSCGSIQSRTF